MFTLIRPLAALALGLLGLFAAQAYRPLNDIVPETMTFTYWTVGLSALVGWVFLGGQMGRALWYSIYASLQAVVLAAIVTSGLFSVYRIFLLGYRRQYREPMEAFTGSFENFVDFLRLALERDFLILLGVGAVIVGLALHAAYWLLERRRLTR